MNNDVTIETMKDSLTQIISALEKLSTEKIEKEKKISELTQKNQELESTIQKIQEKNVGLEGESESIREEYEAINTQLQKLSKEFQLLSDQKSSKIDAREALTLLIVLLRDVFGGQAHGVVLRLLHNQESESLHRDAIAKSTGLGGAIIRKVAADLQQAGIVEYDLETGEVKLIKKIFS